MNLNKFSFCKILQAMPSNVFHKLVKIGWRSVLCKIIVKQRPITKRCNVFQFLL
jgi:hypothetical protein